MSIEDKLIQLGETKNLIKNAIIEKGVEVDSSTPFKDYANKIKEISGGGGSTEWQPDKEWFNIKTILQQDNREYAGKAIILYSDTDAFTTFSKSSSSSQISAIATSDGSFYDSFPVTHYWDRSKDKLSSSGYKTRYLILYFSSSSIPYTEFNSYYKNSLYAVFSCNITKTSTQSFSSNTFFYNNYTIQYFEFLDGYNFNLGQKWDYFCSYCYSLRRLPDNLDTSLATSLGNFCQYCTSLEELPNNLDTSNSTTFNNFCAYSKNLRKLPESLDTSNGTYFSAFCQYCDNLIYIPSVIDLSNNTNSLGNFLYYCSSLKNIKIILGDSNYTLSLGSVGSDRINTESIKFIADNAPTVTSSRTVSFGGANIAACGGASSDIIMTLKNKGWNVT